MPPEVAVITDVVSDVVRVVHDTVAGGVASGSSGSWRPDEGTVAELVRRHRPLASTAEVRELVGRVLDRVAGLGAVQPLLDDPTISEVMVNGPGRPVWIERHGCLHATDVVLDAGAVALLVERIVHPLGLRVDRTRPMLDARLPDGSRVNVAVAPLAVDGPYVTIRRFVARSLPLAALCPAGVDELLAEAVTSRRNIVAVGGTGAGKTTLLNALAGTIPASERIVTVEDAAELELAHPHVVRLEARSPGAGVAAGSAAAVRDLVRNALRMRPDRIIVGEVRGAEALDLLVAMNTGHEGALSTVHANSTTEALARLETMALLAGSTLPLESVRSQLGASLDMLVHVARLIDGRRGVVEVAEVSPDGSRVRRLAGSGGVESAPSRPPRRRGSW